MSVLFTKEGSTYYSYDKNFRKISSVSDNNIRGDIVCINGNVLFTKEGSNYFSYDENFRNIATMSNNNIRGDIKNR